MSLYFSKGVHYIPEKYGMYEFLDGIFKRIDIVAERTKTNEFSGKDFNSVKSIMLQIAQNDSLTKVNKKITCLDIMIAIEEMNK